MGGPDDFHATARSGRDAAAPHDAFAADIAAARAGCHEAFNRLFSGAFDFLRAVAAANLPADLHAKVSPRDLAQESLIEAQAKFAVFNGTTEDELRAWLHGFLANNVSKAARRFFGTQMRNAAREVSLNHDSRADAEGLVDHGILTPSAQCAAGEEERRVADALAHLSDDHRQTILLRNEGLSFAEIGQQCGRTEEAARKLWTRGLIRLRELLGDK